MNVYFIKCCDKNGYIKIGVANDVHERCLKLQTSTPYELEVVASMKFSGKAAAFEAERKLHHLFRNSRIRGEWFKSVDMKFAAEFFNKEVSEREKQTN